MKNLLKKFNLFDGVVLLFVVFAIGFFVVRFMMVEGNYTETQPVTLVFLQGDCSSYVAEQTQVGDTVLDGVKNVQIGQVVQVDSVVVATEDGEVTNVYITVVGDGTPTNNGVVIDYVRYAVGYTTTLYAGYGQYEPTLYSIDWGN